MTIRIPPSTEEKGAFMIFIVVKWTIKARAERRVAAAGRRLHPGHPGRAGNIFFEWSKSVDSPHQFVLVEAFQNGEAGAAHVNSDHFKTAMAWMPEVVAQAPEIINVERRATTGARMAEVTPSGA